MSSYFISNLLTNNNCEALETQDSCYFLLFTGAQVWQSDTGTWIRFPDTMQHLVVGRNVAKKTHIKPELSQCLPPWCLEADSGAGMNEEQDTKPGERCDILMTSLPLCRSVIYLLIQANSNGKIYLNQKKKQKEYIHCNSSYSYYIYNVIYNLYYMYI